MESIKIYPSKLCGSVTAPPSKSDSHRALICAALCDGPTVIKNCGNSDDINATISVLSGFGATFMRNGNEITVYPAKTAKPISKIADCNESGSTLRFLLPVAAALGVETEFVGKGRLPLRPIDTLTDLLNNHNVKCNGSTLPLKISGKLSSGLYRLAGNISSQYISGLLMALSVTKGQSKIELTTVLESKPYVDMTLDTLKKFGADIIVTDDGYLINGKEHLTPCEYTVEGDWSQAAFFMVAGALGNGITLKGLNLNSFQGDKKIIDVLKTCGADVSISEDGITVKNGDLKAIEIDGSQIPDIIPIISVLSAFCEGTTTIHSVERLAIKESNRITETVSRLNTFGIDAICTHNTITVTKSVPHGTEIDSANDHRIVMSFAVLASMCQNESIINNFTAINKSYPDFFKDFKNTGGKVDVINNG